MKKVVVLLLSLALVGPGAALAEVNGTWSVGVTGQYDLPLFKLKNWFPSGGIDFGGTVSRINNETWTFELDARYAKYGSGELGEPIFLWSVDQQEKDSPPGQIGNDVAYLDDQLSLPFQRREGKTTNRGRRAVFCDRRGCLPLRKQNQRVDLSRAKRNAKYQFDATARGRCSHGSGRERGLGVEYFAAQNFAFDVRAQYHIIWGHCAALRGLGFARGVSISQTQPGRSAQVVFSNH